MKPTKLMIDEYSRTEKEILGTDVIWDRDHEFPKVDPKKIPLSELSKDYDGDLVDRWDGFQNGWRAGRNLIIKEVEEFISQHGDCHGPNDDVTFLQHEISGLIKQLKEEK